MYQPQPSSTSRRILVVLALLLFIVALVLVIVQSFTNDKGRAIIGTYGHGYQDGYNAAREIAKKISPLIAEPRHSLSGTIKSISGNDITIQAENVFVDEAVDGVGLTRKIKIGAETKILKKTRKDSSEMDRELASFSKALAVFNPNQDNASPPEPPSSFEESEISISDLAEGDMITVYGTNDEDLTFAETIAPIKVTVREREPVPVEPEAQPEDIVSDEAVDDTVETLTDEP